MAARKVAARPPREQAVIDLTPKQQLCLKTKASIVIFGGGNGGGKTQLLMYAALQHISVPGFDAVLFHETLPLIKMAGGILDRSKKIYGPIHPKGDEGLNLTDRRWRFPTRGAESSITMSFVGEPGAWDGLEAALLGIDQVEKISEAQFFSLVSRCRSTCGAPERVIATANPPGPDSWLTKFLMGGGWIGVDGYPRPELDGVVRYYARAGDEFVWADDPAELDQYLERDAAGQAIPPKSVAFVAALVDDNPYGSENYKQTLASLPEVERLRRLKGNWLVTEEAGRYFRAEFFPIRDLVASPKARRVRSWDNAWSDASTADRTSGTLIAIEPSGEIIIEDCLVFRGTAAQVERAIELTAQADGKGVTIRIPKDAGQGGIEQSAWARRLGSKGFTVVQTADRGDKLERSKPYQACAERRQISLARAHATYHVAAQLGEPWTLPDGSTVKGCDVVTKSGWHSTFIAEHVAFGKRGPSGKLAGKKDIVDSVVAGYLYLTSDSGIEIPEPSALAGAAAAAARIWGGAGRSSPGASIFTRKGSPGALGGRRSLI